MNIHSPLHHIAIIPDGNRRWANSRGVPVDQGHKRGFLEVSPQILQAAWNSGLHTMTLWAFSTENWTRSPSEVSHLMGIFHDFIRLMLPVALKMSVKIRHLGRTDRIPEFLLDAINEAEETTQLYESHTLNFAVDYGGRDDIMRALKKMLSAVNNKGLDIEKVTEGYFDSFLDTSNQKFPSPDLIIRTSGEKRISGFMPWQCSYSEFYFEQCLFPDYCVEGLKQAIDSFYSRKRRFGG